MTTRDKLERGFKLIATLSDALDELSELFVEVLGEMPEHATEDNIEHNPED